jgi:hypothetical protein
MSLVYFCVDVWAEAMGFWNPRVTFYVSSRVVISIEIHLKVCKIFGDDHP